MEGFRGAQLRPPLPNLPFTVNYGTPQAQGLVAWWPLDGIAGRTVECRIRAGNRGTLGSTLVPYNVVRPSYFDGALGIRSADDGVGGTNYITTGFDDALNDFTATCWFQLAVDTFAGRIIDKDVTSGFGIFQNTAGPTYAARILGTDTSNLTLANTVTWHVAIRRSGTAGAFIANGGALKATSSVSSSATNTTALGIGATSAGDNRSFVHIRDVRVYNRALTDAEIWALYDPLTRFELYYPLGQKAYQLPLGSATPPPPTRSQVIICG